MGAELGGKHGLNFYLQSHCMCTEIFARFGFKMFNNISVKGGNNRANFIIKVLGLRGPCLSPLEEHFLDFFIILRKIVVSKFWSDDKRLGGCQRKKGKKEGLVFLMPFKKGIKTLNFSLSDPFVKYLRYFFK